MEKKKVLDILEFLSVNYTTFGDPNTKYETWNSVLKDYVYDEVIDRINELMTRKEFLTTCPTITAIVSPLTKIKDKVSFEGAMFSCQFCGRIFDTKEEMETHEDRCRSIRYIEKQYKRFGKGPIDKRILFDMQEDEFQEKYKILLKFVYEHTNNDFEKQIIENIFNPPTPEKAREVLNKANSGDKE